MKILFTGPVGSGKSTQAELLAKYLNIPLFQTGQITRELAKEDSDLGNRVKMIMESGELVDDKTIAEVLKRVMSQADLKRGFIIDGYPRSLEQLNLFDPGFEIVINFKISNKIVLERLLKRQRVDDTPEAIEKRLKIYYQQTKALIEHYRKSGILKEVNAENSIEEIENETRKVLGLNGQIEK